MQKKKRKITKGYLSSAYWGLVSIIIAIMIPIAWLVSRFYILINRTSIGRKRALKRAFEIERELGVHMDVRKYPRFGWAETLKDG